MKDYKHLGNILFSRSQWLVVSLYVIPFVFLCGLGILWVFQNNFAPHFFVFCLLLSLVALSVRLFSIKRRRESFNKQFASAKEHNQKQSRTGVKPNPEWSERQKNVLASLVPFIDEQFVNEKNQAVIEWNELPYTALSVIQKVAIEIGGSKKKPLDFTAPEALLLVEQTASRYRAHVRHALPYAENISIGSLYWAYEKRKGLSLAWKLADGGRRLARFASNPMGAAIKELEQLITGGNTQYLSDQVIITLQRILLEEVASVAIDLYSGRLKFSDDELETVHLESTTVDEHRTAQLDTPLRIILVGQTSSGKSSLLNNLLTYDGAETDAAATTDTISNYITTLNEMPCHILDSPGIDGGEKNTNMLFKEITDSDIVIWTLRTNRPSRSADVALLNDIYDWEKANPLRRKPVLIFVGTFADRIAKTWPIPEHEIPQDTQAIFNKASQAIKKEIKAKKITLISNTFPAWNIDSVALEVESQVQEGLMVQKNRKRLAVEKKSSHLKNSARTIKGLLKSATFIGAKWLNGDK